MQTRMPVTGSSLTSYAMIVELKGEMKREKFVIVCQTIKGSGFCLWSVVEIQEASSQIPGNWILYRCVDCFVLHL